MSDVLWRGTELADLFDQPQFDSDVSGISIDSRSLQQGDLFIALKDVRDGHEFVGAAAEQGAAAAMVSQEVAADLPQLRVADTYEGLWRLAQGARARMQGKVVAITGSSGKTTLRGWAEQVLQTYDATHASVGSFNNHLGVPLSLARLPATSRYGVFEVGTSNPGEISPLSRLVQPHVSVLLNVLPAHIGNFADMAALREEKISISDGLQPDGVFVLSHKLVGFLSPQQKAKLNLMTFGTEPDADVRLVDVSGDRLSVNTPSGQLELQVPFSGAERHDSVVALVAVLCALDLDPAVAIDAFSELELPSGRGNRIRVGDITVIDDSYNANAVSMKMALTALAASESKGRKIALLGEILELGDLSLESHQEVLDGTTGLDEVWTFGDGFAALRTTEGRQHCHQVDDFDLKAFAGRLQPGDVVLVKGSNLVFWKHNFVNKLCELLES